MDCKIKEEKEMCLDRKLQEDSTIVQEFWVKFYKTIGIEITRQVSAMNEGMEKNTSIMKDSF